MARAETAPSQTSDEPGQAQQQAQSQGKPGKLEFNLFPIAGGDSDVGFGGGQFGNVARLGSGEGDFVWKVDESVFSTFKLRDGDVIVPYFDAWALLTVPHFGPGGRLRLEVRPSHTDERTLGYYGIGNASVYPEGIPNQEHEYRRVHPTLAAKLRIRLFGHCFGSIGSNFTYSHLEVGANTLLTRDRLNGSPEVQQLLGDFRSHATELFEIGVEYDTRDQETVPRSGQYHMLLARMSPGLASWMPYSYVQLEAIGRYYLTVVPRWLTLAARVVGDTFIGDPPFYELARYDDTPAIGGGKAIRGIPAQRYHGKVKVFGNFEMRSEVFPFTIRNKPFVLGFAAFFDAGRTWSEMFRRRPELDGHGVGLKYGMGGGIRFQQGKTFVVRADVAWSPDARPLGAYVDAGQLF